MKMVFAVGNPSRRIGALVDLNVERVLVSYIYFAETKEQLVSTSRRHKEVPRGLRTSFYDRVGVLT